MKNKQRIIKPRHKLFKCLLTPVFGLSQKFNNIHVKKELNIKGPALILCNHQTSDDQFYVNSMFKDPIRFVATEDIFSNGLSSSIIRYMANPIMKMKAVPDIATIRDCSNTIKQNGLVLIFPEGNRTYSSKLCHIDISIAKLVKKFNVDTYFINIIGGYPHQPRWSKTNRNCRVDVNLINKISKEEIENIGLEDLYSKILTNLDVFDKEKNITIKNNKNRALYLERLFYVCPKCGSISSLHSFNNSINCDKCDFSATYNKDLTFTSNLKLLDDKKIDTWYDYQETWIKNKSLDYFNKYIFNDENVTLKQSIINKNKILIGNGPMKMNNEFLELDTKWHTYSFPLKEILAITILGKHKMNIYLPGNTIYQFVGNETFNPMKYMHLYYHVKYIQGGKQDDEFLGI